MGLPAYYTEESSSPPDPTQLPISWDPLSNPYPAIRDQILLETGGGVTFEYELFRRDTPTFVFTVPKSLLPQFRAMHDAVVGSAFYFMPDVDASPLDVLYVRKEPNFDLEPIGVYLFEGRAEQHFRYQLKLRTEISAASIED